MSKHTLGPWTFNQEEPHIIYSIATQRAVACTDDETLANEPDSNVRLANARLIAAAPELLEALKALLSGSERHIFSTECKTERDAARTAIAKAEGRS